jgi:hypothetical protein
MSTDIYGWVETHFGDKPEWDAAIRIRPIVHRQYGMFASLFGVRNAGLAGSSGVMGRGVTAVGRFRAIAPGRGAPRAAARLGARPSTLARSLMARASARRGCSGASWRR